MTVVAGYYVGDGILITDPFEDLDFSKRDSSSFMIDKSLQEVEELLISY